MKTENIEESVDTIEGGFRMTEKVVLTKEQAKAIEEIKDIDYAINIHSFNKRPDSPLADIKTSTLARALFVGYEVEPEFKVGDWVYDIQYNKVARIDHRGVDDNRVWVDDEDFNFFAIVNIRHATPEEIAEEKERRLFAEHGRKVWELKKYDRIKCKSTDKEYEILDVEKPLRFKVLDMRDVHLRNLEFYNTQQISSRFVVVCFAENRLDVK